MPFGEKGEGAMNESVGFQKVFDEELRAIEIRRGFHQQLTPTPSSRSKAGTADGEPDLDAAGKSNGGERGRASNGNGHSPTGATGRPPEEAGTGPFATNASPDVIANNLAGLALSGGGIRSASFNLGMVQALDKHGVFAQVDYLSTVSGGGYLGGYLSSLALDSRDDDPRHAADNNANGAGQAQSAEVLPDGAGCGREQRVTPLAPRPRSPQPKRVRKLIYSGDYLRLPLGFLNRYLMGLLVVNLFALSGIIAAGAGVAWLFRCLDETNARYALQALGFGDDVSRALFPSFIIGVFWLVIWASSYGRAASGAWSVAAQGSLLLLVASLLVGMATLLGNGSIDMKSVAELFQIRLEPSTVDSIRNVLVFAVISPILLFLLPYFRPDRLIKSGITPSPKWWERMIFKFAGLALLVGVPLLVTGYFARENISNINATRDGTLARTDVDWTSFWRQIQAESNPDTDPPTLSDRLWNSPKKKISMTSLERVDERKLKGLSKAELEAMSETIRRRMPKEDGTTIPATEKLLATIRRIESENAAIEQQLWLPRRWLSFGGAVLATVTNDGNEKNNFLRLFDGYRDVHFLKMAAIENVNACLRDQTLWQSRQPAPSSTPLTPQLSDDQKRQVAEAIREAKAVELEAPEELGNDPASDQWRENVTNANRQLLIAWYGDKVVTPKDSPARLPVVIDHDQRYRAQVFGWMLLLFLVGGLVLNLNGTSLHGYYRSQLANSWIEDCDGLDRDIPLARLDTTARGYPYHLICATANHFCRENGGQASAGHFLFSRLYCGSSRTGYVATKSYAGGRFDLASAMAISAAAVSPSRMKNWFSALLLFVLNFRLGQWLPNPGHQPWRPRRMFRLLARWPSPFFVLASLARSSQTRAYCFVTDGGHHENLGIAPLLRRRCRLIICCDAGHDPDYQFSDFVTLQRQERLDNGTEICALDQGVLSFDHLYPDKEQRLSKANFVLAKIQYPDFCREGEPVSQTGPEDGVGYLIYVKPTFVGKEELDLVTEMRSKSPFPHDTTADQFYPPEKFEAYRRLGYHIGEMLCLSGLKEVRLTGWTPKPPDEQCPEPEPLKELVRFAKQALARFETAGPKPSIDKTTVATSEQDELRRVIEKLFEPVFEQRSQAMEFAERALENAQTREQALAILIEAIHRPGDSKLRETAMAPLLHYAGESPLVQELAMDLCLNANESLELRSAAMDLLADTDVNTASARGAIARLFVDPDKEIRLRASNLFGQLGPVAEGRPT
jgi:hypothetical protein